MVSHVLFQQMAASSKWMIGKSQGAIIMSYKPITKAIIMSITKSTKSVAMALGCHALVLGSAAATDASSLEGVRRMVFLGDSITQAGVFVTDVECWLISRGHQFEVLNIGLSSETATALTKEENDCHVKAAGFPRPFVGDRLERSLALTKPDLLFVCYGMNDAASLPEGTEGLARYAEAMTRLREIALRSGVKRVVICTPPIHDPKEVTDPAKDPHERNLVAYREWLLSKRADAWEVVDIHGPMRRELNAARKNNPAFRFQPDGIHPDRAGHGFMAREILNQFFGANIDGISSSPQFFRKNGDQIRGLVDRRQKILFSSLMTQIGHIRPNVPGGPDAPPGPSSESAQTQSAEITKSITSLLLP